MIQSFYRLMTEKVARLKTGIQDDFKVLDFMIKLESYICDHAYSILFCSGYTFFENYLFLFCLIFLSDCKIIYLIIILKLK